MTRLRTEWVEDIYTDLEAAQKSLLSKCGTDYAALAARVCGVTRDALIKEALHIRAAAVPVSQGQGVIGRFSETVAAILRVSGFSAFLTAATDVCGIQEAHDRGANALFLADDRRFIALHTEKGTLADNNEATVLGYLAALEAVAGGFTGKDVLVLGCGRLGGIARKELKRRGAEAVAFDRDPEALARASAEGFSVIRHAREIAGFRLVFDTTSSGDWLGPGMIHPEALIAALGVPLSLDAAARAVHDARLIHDLLPIGVVSMFGLLCFPPPTAGEN